MEGGVVEAEGMGRIVTGRADLGVIRLRIFALWNEVRAQVRSAATVARFAADVLEVGRAAKEIVAAGFFEADDMAADAIRSSIGRVGNQCVECAGVLRVLPGRVFLLMTGSTRIVAAITLRVEQHRHADTCGARGMHAQQSAVALAIPALAAMADASLCIDDHDDRHAAGHAPALRCLAARIEVGVEEVESEIRERFANRGG